MFRVWGEGTDGLWRLASVRVFADWREAEQWAEQLQQVYGGPVRPGQKVRQVAVFQREQMPQPAAVESARFVAVG